jgi:16S rRNA (uracil1498-N3)-methyltransferase
MRAMVIKASWTKDKTWFSPDHAFESFNFWIEGEEAHHCLHVCRIQKNEKILFLSGDGIIFHGEVLEVQKKKLNVVIRSFEHQKRHFAISQEILIPYVKKSALEDCIKRITELGFEGLHLCTSDYSQSEIFLKEERLMALIESSMEQSNNAYRPFIKHYHHSLRMLLEQSKLEQGEDFLSPFDEVVIFDPYVAPDSSINRSLNLIKKRLVILGPEGGLSREEISILSRLKKTMRFIQIPTPLLRVEHALSVATGMLFSRNG